MASMWWEKHFAMVVETTISPNKCYRLETLEPFWILPSFVHPKPHVDPETELRWLSPWQQPGFFRLYHHRTGKILGESTIYDLQEDMGGGGLSWNYAGRDETYAGMIRVGRTLPECREQ